MLTIFQNMKGDFIMKKLTLFDYLELTEEGQEITVTDQDYDTETYFYKYEPENAEKWDESMKKLSQLLTVTKIFNHAVEVNLSNIIEKKLSELKKADLFIYCDIDNIMDDINNILAGNVSEEWMEKFINVLSY